MHMDPADVLHTVQHWWIPLSWSEACPKDLTICPAGMLQKGQLGHGDQLHRNIPTIVEKLKDMHIVGGRLSHHVTSPESAFAVSHVRPLSAQCNISDNAG